MFFTYGLVLATFYHIQEARTGLYILPLAAGNFLGPLLLGHLFDTVGRKTMIAGTYGLSGVLLIGGTGSVAFGRSPAGATARCGGWGPVCGDEGSGARQVDLLESMPDRARRR